MKKLFAILLIPVFLISIQGMAITSLYCQGAITKVGFHITSCCKDVNKKGCCKTESHVLKIKDNFIKSFYADVKITGKCILTFNNYYFSAVLLSLRTLNHIGVKAPPLLTSSLYILFRSLLI